MLSEHKLDCNEIDHVIVPNYKVKSYYCRKTFSGGGVMILVSDSVEAKLITFPAVERLVADKEFECCLVEVKLKPFSLLLIAIYRTPGVAFENIFLDKLNALLGIVSKSYTNIAVAGDINIDVLKISKAQNTFFNILKEFNMHYLVNFPTRVTLECESAIDNIFTTIPKHFLSISGLVTELSDHDAQLLDITIFEDKQKCQTPLTKTSRKFTEENIKRFRRFLQNESWSEMYSASVESKYDVFFNVFFYYFDICFPKIKSRLYSKEKKWITPELRKEKNDIINLSQTIRLTKDTVLKQLLKNHRKTYYANINVTKQKFIENTIRSSDNVTKATWKLINSEIKHKNILHNKDIKLIIDSIEHTEPQEVCELFNDHFISVVDNFITPNLTSGSSCSSTPLIEGRPKFRIKPVNETEIDKIISSFENKFASGFDEIPMPIIKNTREFLIKPLAHLINSSFISGIFPSKLKISKILTLHKGGIETDPSSYRPLSILPTISKIFERAMHSRLVDFLSENELFDDEQHGFRSNRSVTTASIGLVENIIDAIDKGEKAVGIFMDLSKAFDSVSHPVLISILQNIGITSVSLKWFKSYLENRKQYVELSHVTKLNHLISFKSSLKEIKFGVPQGSILGPVLFLCYLKGLPSALTNKNSKLCIYADDSNLIVSGKTVLEVQTSARNNLLSVRNHFNSKNLLLNFNKTNMISFSLAGKANFRTIVDIHDVEVSQVKLTKFLGLLLDENLSWNHHVNKIKNKISSGLFVLRNLSKYCSLEILLKVYHSHINSHITFGVELYGSTSNQNLESILILQKKAIRIMLNLDHNESVKDYFSELKILTVYGLYILQTVMFVKSAAGIPKLGTNHKYNTRHRNLPAVPRHSLEIYKKKPSTAGIRFLYCLPKEITSITNINIFRRRLKLYLIEKSFYSLKELFEI